MSRVLLALGVAAMLLTPYALAQMPVMSPAQKASMYCQGKIATFPPLEATVECLYVRHLYGNRYAVVVRKLD